jgi:hypothetical protein
MELFSWNLSIKLLDQDLPDNVVIKFLCSRSLLFGSRGIRQFCDQITLLQVIACICLHTRKVDRKIKIHIFVSMTSK